MKPVYILGLMTLLGVLLLSLLGGVRPTSAAPAALPAERLIYNAPAAGVDDPCPPCPTATPTCQPGTICNTPTATPSCDPVQPCNTPTPTATPRCDPVQPCETPTPTATPRCDPALPCDTPTPTATPPCDPAGSCASPTPTATPPCDPALPCGSPTPTPTCHPGQNCETPSATATRPAQPTSTPPCQPGVTCETPSATATRPAQPTSTPTCLPSVGCQSPTPSATPTCHPGQNCETPSATATRPAQPTSTPTCQPGTICQSPTPSATPTCRPGQNCETPTATPTCRPGRRCATPTATPTRSLSPTRTATPTPTRCVQPPANMSAWYPLDEPVGPIAGEIVGGVNGVHIGGPSPVPGKVAGGLSFDGVNDYVQVPNNTALNFGTGDFSIDTWIKTSQATGLQVFIDKRSYAPVGYALVLYNGRLLFQMADSSGFSNYWNSSSVIVADGNWHLVAVTVQRTGTPVGRLYVDGVVITTFVPRPGNITNLAGLWLGRHHPNALYPSTLWYRGSLDEVEFFKRALTTAEIGGLWTAGSAGKCKPAGSPTPTRTPTPGPCRWCYLDVPIISAFYPYVSCLTIQGVVAGYPCGGPNEPCAPPDNQPYYRPGAGVTRGQVAKIVAAAAGFAEQPATQTFADVPAAQPFYLWIEQMAGRGIINGYPCGGAGEPCDGQQRPYFRPAAPVTRGQLAKIAANAAGYAEPIPADQQTFADVLPGSGFWVYTERMALHAVINGYPCGGAGEPCDPPGRPYYRPAAGVTRGQTAKIVANTFSPDCDVPGSR